jgi:para-aminobenzoate synthetase component 1
LFCFTFHDQLHCHDAAIAARYHVQSPHSFERISLAPCPRMPEFIDPLPLRSTFSKAAYESAVRRALEYIAAGDIFQVNLSQRFTGCVREPPYVIYERMRFGSPAWFGAFLSYDDHALLCNSPELYLRVTPDDTGHRTVITRPIKGTRPRQPGMDEQLLNSLKDQAELNMIVDLERNDLGRVCHIGSVRVVEPRTIEAHPTVYHGVSTIQGELRDDVNFVELLRATFPGGSITGAPKIRAMQIIEELEPVRRGPYCGAIGYVSVDGHVEFNIAIRTIIAQPGIAHVPVGGGIVADSDPAAEYEETLIKAKAMMDALGWWPA